MKAGVLLSEAYLVADQVSGRVIRAIGMRVSEPPAPPLLIAPLPDGAGSSIVFGPPLPPISCCFKLKPPNHHLFGRHLVLQRVEKSLRGDDSL